MLESCSFCFSVKWFSRHADHRNGLYSQCLDLDQTTFTATISEILSALSTTHIFSMGRNSGILGTNLNLKFLCIADSGKGSVIL